MPHVQPEAPSASAAILELLSWISARPRTYGETMDVWRTSCPRSSTWEDATVGGFVEVSSERDVGMRESIVRLTRAGRAILAADGPVSEGHR